MPGLYAFREIQTNRGLRVSPNQSICDRVTVVVFVCMVGEGYVTVPR